MGDHRCMIYVCICTPSKDWKSAWVGRVSFGWKALAETVEEAGATCLINYVDVRASRASELVWAVHTVATCGSCDLLGITCECKEMAQREPVVEDQRGIRWWLQHAASQGLPRPGDQDQWPSWPSCPTRTGKQTAQAPTATNWSRQLGGVGLCDLLWLHASCYSIAYYCGGLICKRMPDLFNCRLKMVEAFKMTWGTLAPGVASAYTSRARDSILKYIFAELYIIYIYSPLHSSAPKLLFHFCKASFEVQTSTVLGWAKQMRQTGKLVCGQRLTGLLACTRVCGS